MFNFFSLSVALQGSTKHAEHVTAKAIITIKTNHTPQQMETLTSFATQIPELFYGPKEAWSEVSCLLNFSGIKTPELWDQGNEETGV